MFGSRLCVSKRVRLQERIKLTEFCKLLLQTGTAIGIFRKRHWRFSKALFLVVGWCGEILKRRVTRDAIRPFPETRDVSHAPLRQPLCHFRKPRLLPPSRRVGNSLTHRKRLGQVFHDKSEHLQVGRERGKGLKPKVAFLKRVHAPKKTR